MAMNGFAMGGICYDTQADAIAAFVSQFPQITGQFLITSNAVASGASSMSVSTSIANLTISPLAYTAHNYILPLRLCDPLLDLNRFVPPTPANILYVFSWGFGAVVFFFFLGFVIGAVAKVINKA